MTRSLPTVSPDALVATLGDEAVILDLASRRYFQLNATGAAIWQSLVAGEDREVAVSRLVETFDVATAAASEAVDAFIGQLRTRALVRDP